MKRVSLYRVRSGSEAFSCWLQSGDHFPWRCHLRATRCRLLLRKLGEPATGFLAGDRT